MAVKQKSCLSLLGITIYLLDSNQIEQKRSIEPPPILQLYWENATDEELKKHLQSPFYFMVANLVSDHDPLTILSPTKDYLSGTTVSSLHRLRDLDNSDGGFFVFGDLAVKVEGKFKLQFSLFEITDGQVKNRKTSYSDTFTVYIPKRFPGPLEATFLSRTFSDQGVKMRIRKEHRIQSKRKSSASDQTLKKSQPKKKSQKNANKISDVYYGKWQATTKQHHDHSISPPLSIEEDDKMHKSKFQECFSPESSTSSYVLPLKYNSQRLPTPPLTELHRDNQWGARLPPLRAIMNNDNNHSLLLPPPVISKYVSDQNPYLPY